MANNIYGYGSSGYGGGYSSLASTDPYSSSSWYSGSNPLVSSSEITRYSSAALDHVSSLYSTPSGIPGIGSSSAPSIYQHSSWSGIDGAGALSGIKRSAEALYNQTILGSHNSIGQSEGLFSTNSMFKFPRLESGSNLLIYPQHPGEKDCAHYMLTRTCKFGESCKFDHPIWVPAGGIPDWKEVPLAATTEPLPERPGEPDCPYFMKTQNCKFGFRCKFNHPKDKLNGGLEFADPSLLPERPSEPICSFYAKTGNCKFGATCKFHHPKDLQIPLSGQDAGSIEQREIAFQNNGLTGDSMAAKAFVPFTPALLHNSKGLPIRPGETDCPFYLKTGSCKYGATCRYNHPDMIVSGGTVVPSASSFPTGLFNQVSNYIPSLDPLFAQASLGITQTVYPQRPGELECDFYMKNGHCKFGERCRFHHPLDRTAPTALVAKQAQPGVKLTPAGLPRREGLVACPFYMKTGTCKYGVTCRFDHPPPGEAIAMATAEGAGVAATGSDGAD